MNAPTILITAFEPFGGETINPSAEAVRLLPAEIGGCRIRTLTLPVTFSGCFSPLLEVMRALSPAAVVCVGQAGGRDALTPERIAVNLDDTLAPDNAGDAPCERPIVPGAPAAYFSTLPLRRMTERIMDAGVPARISNTAGTYVCNHLMYLLLHELATEKPACLGGFVHVPYVSGQAADKKELPRLPLDTIARGLYAAAEAVAQAITDPARS